MSDQSPTLPATLPTPRKRTVAQTLASAIMARRNCNQSGKTEWYDRWTKLCERIESEFLPRGSGVDNGTRIDWSKSTGARIVLACGYHHINDSGIYSGWSEHTITITPDWEGINITIGGRDRNGIKEYLSELYHAALSEPCAIGA